MIKDDRYFMNIAYNEALKAYKKNESPIVVVIVKDNEIVAKAHNLRDSKQIVTKHAEIIAIEKANIKESNWRLVNHTLYTTLEPCDMCDEIIKEAKISKVIYAAKNKNKKNFSKFTQIDDKNVVFKCESIIKDKYLELRSK